MDMTTTLPKILHEVCQMTDDELETAMQSVVIDIFGDSFPLTDDDFEDTDKVMDAEMKAAHMTKAILKRMMDSITALYGEEV